MKHTIYCPDTGEEVDNYQDYLNTRHWQELRQRYHLKGAVCGICKCPGAMHLHHKTYKRIGRELKQDVVLLCSVCHQFIHDRVAQKRSTVAQTTAMLKAVAKGLIKFECEKAPRVNRKRQFSLRLVESSMLPETLHHSIHSLVPNMIRDGLSVEEIMVTYERIKQKDLAMLQLFKDNEILVYDLVDDLYQKLKNPGRKATPKE